MKYPLIAAKVARETWAIRPEVFQAIHNAIFGEHGAAPFAVRDSIAIPDEDEDEDSMFAASPVRVIQVFGILGKHLDQMEMACGGCSVDRIAAQLTAADRDPECSRIVLALHTPGGTVTGIPELAAKIADVGTRKPVIAYTDSECCSAGLWLASQAETFLVSPSSNVGSVGVFCLLLDETKRLEMEGVKVNAIVDGKFKLAGSRFHALTDDERAQFEAKVKAVGTAFRAALTSRRTIAAEHLQGQVFTGIEAVANGMADGLADDISEVLEMALS